MINLWAYGFSFLLGFLFIRLILGEKTNISLLLHCALAIGLGLGICATTTFFFILIFGEYVRAGIIALNSFILILLFTLNFIFIKKTTYLAPQEKMKHEKSFLALAFIFWSIACGLIIVHSQQFTFGGWDAWGLYNMKAKFILFGGKNWADIVKLHWHTQPSYPLLLPLANSWIFSFFQKNLIEVASMTGVVFSIACGFLLYAGLSLTINRAIALIASILLLTTPLYGFWSTVQYADVLFAYYVLASMILLVLTLKTLDQRVALLAGLFWGLMPFTKNEGIVIVGLLGITTSIILISNKNYDRILIFKLIRNLVLGAGITTLANLIFKIFFAPTTREVLFNPLTSTLPYANFAGFWTTIIYFLKTITALGWTFIWILIALIGIVNYRKWFVIKESRIIVMVLAGFGLSLLYVYMTTTHCDLLWRLECTSTRISAYLLPTALFLSFYTLWTKPPKD